MTTPRPDDLDALLVAPALPGDPRPGTRALERSALGRLGIELVAAAADRVVMRMPAPARADRALLHVLGESLASTGAGIAAGTGRRAFGVALETTHLEDATPAGVVVGVGEPLLVEPGCQAWRIDAWDEHGTHVVTGRCSLSVVADPGA